MKTILVDAANTFVIKGQGIDREMHAILEELPNEKIILTNADDEGFQKYGLDKMPYEVFTLKNNPNKKDPEYYRIFLKEHDLKPDDVIYFEHNPNAVASAQSVGIETFHFDKDKRDLDQLKTFLSSHL